LKIERIQVPPEDRERLERLVKDRNTPQKIVWRSQIVLFAGEGNGAVAVARRIGKSVLTVRRWRRRYAAKGVDGLLTAMQLWTAPRQLLTFARWRIVIARYAFRGDVPWGTTLR